jgi:hypothetical protein
MIRSLDSRFEDLPRQHNRAEDKPQGENQPKSILFHRESATYQVRDDHDKAEAGCVYHPPPFYLSR